MERRLEYWLDELALMNNNSSQVVHECKETIKTFPEEEQPANMVKFNI